MRFLAPCIGAGVAMGVAHQQLAVWMALGAALGMLLSRRDRR